MFTRLGMRYVLRHVTSSVAGFSTLTLSSHGSLDISYSSLSLMSVRVMTSMNPRPTITSLMFSEKELMGSSPPAVCLSEYTPPKFSNPYPTATSS